MAGLPVTDRVVAKHLWPQYMLVGAFIPSSEKEAQLRHEREVTDRRLAGLEGPAQKVTLTKNNVTDNFSC